MAIKDIPELLAPAGSLNALKAAVNAGADAVYISGKKFGARKFAANFTREEILEGLKFAKIRNVKVYITVNTLMKDFQLKGAIEYIFWLYKNGADAIIVQDLGLAALCRELVPEMNIHASTQLTIHNSAGVRWACKFGFKRIVLSRELSIYEVKEIMKVASNHGLEIEIFGHGALCYSYSGQCLLSSFIGGRSGNRGVCAQPCRKAYRLIAGKIDEYGRPADTHPVNIKDKYLLSTKDLCIYNQLVKIMDSGVNSLKIEGRMRSAEYVAVAVKIYRKALDSLKTGKWNPKKEDLSKLKLAFNRGFSEGYLFKSAKNLVMGQDAPGNRGLYIGEVDGYNNRSKIATIKLKNNYKIEKGDGVVFRGSRHPTQTSNGFLGKKFRREELQTDIGMAIEEDPIYKGNILKLKVQKPLYKYSKLYLTRSLSLNREASHIIKTDQNPSIPINMKVSLESAMKLKIEGNFTGFDGREHLLYKISDFKMEQAINKPLNNKKIGDQFTKTGRTIFKIDKLNINVPETLFTPLSNLNKLRREFLEYAEFELIKTFKPSESEVLKIKKRFKEYENRFSSNESNSNPKTDRQKMIGAYLNSIDGLKGALEGGTKRIYFEPEIRNDLSKCDLKDLKLSKDEKNQISSQLNVAKNLCQEYDAEFIWKWPQITHDNLIHGFMQILESIKGIREIMVDGHGAGEALKSITGIKLSCSAGFNVWNKETLMAISKNYDSITPSPELSKKDLKNVVGGSRALGVENPIEIIVQGNLDALISRDCLLEAVKGTSENKDQDFWGIKDEKNHIFPVKIDLNGNTHVLNSVELCLLDHIDELVDLGVDRFVIDMRTKGYEYSKEMSSIYSQYLNQIVIGKDSMMMIKKFKSRIKNISTGGITTGNYLKGVKDVQL